MTHWASARMQYGIGDVQTLSRYDRPRPRGFLRRLLGLPAKVDHVEELRLVCIQDNRAMLQRVWWLPPAKRSQV